MKHISKLISINVPNAACNLRCEYCYITHAKQWKDKGSKIQYSAEHIGKALSIERLGGVCLINLTGNGETLLQEEVVPIIRAIGQQGHYLEIVTNGTLKQRFEEIAQFERELLERIEFKFSFHYLELLRTNHLEDFFYVVNLMKGCGCSYTIEAMPYDELITHIDDIKSICQERFGALCHLTVGRADAKKDRRLLTDLSKQEYIDTWKSFESDMFDFKMQLFGVRRKEFCYAGKWSLYVDLETGEAKKCYGQLPDQNIFKDLSKPIKFKPVGRYCRQPYCYNGHIYLTLGMIPELDTLTYDKIRNRECSDGSSWLTDPIKRVFAQKIGDHNERFNEFQKALYTIKTPFGMIPAIFASRKAIIKKIKKKIKSGRHNG